MPERSTADVADAAAAIATAAGERLVKLRASGLAGTDLGVAGDAMSHVFIVGELSRLFPEDRIRSEEGALTDVAESTMSRVWIVDPLDGTREFAEPRREDWAVHVALVIDGTLVAGAVALPARGLTLSTSPPPPARAPWSGAPRMVVSRTRPSEHARNIAEALGAEMMPMGSAGAKAMAVVLGEADIYAHSGGQYEWDSAAPVAVAQAAGLHVSRLDGSSLRYDQPDPWLPDLLVCPPDLAESALAICRELPAAS